jgi:hypothetical protein
MKNLPNIKKDKEQLLSELADLRVRQGYSKRSLVEYVMANYPVKERMAYKIVKESAERLGEAYNNMVGDAFSDAIMVLENMRQEAIQSGQMKIALDIQKELNRVNQLYVEKQEITIAAEQPLFKEEDGV